MVYTCTWSELILLRRVEDDNNDFSKNQRVGIFKRRHISTSYTTTFTTIFIHVPNVNFSCYVQVSARWYLTRPILPWCKLVKPHSWAPRCVNILLRSKLN